MEKSWIYIAFATIMILLMFLLTIFLIEISSVITLGNRVENSLIGAGWAGFSEMDLEKMAQRKVGLGDPQTREVYLDKVKAENVVRQYICENLKLNINYVSTDESYIPHKTNPVVIDEIRIFNPDDLPTIASNGTSITRTTIHIVVQIPLDIKGIGFVYVKKNVFVDIDSFMQ